MPVRIGMPTDVKGIIDEVQHPAFSTAIGLVRYGMNVGGTKQSSMRFSLPGGNIGVSKAIKKLLNLIKTFIP